MNKLMIFFLSLILLGVAVSASALTRSEVEKNLICYACPGEALNIDSCARGDLMRADIDRMLELGEDKQTILDSFVERFGTSILTAPPRTGFNLVAYAAPFIGLLFGLVLAVFFIRKWSVAGKTNTKAKEYDAKAEALYNDMQDKVEEELKRLEDDS